MRMKSEYIFLVRTECFCSIPNESHSKIWLEKRIKHVILYPFFKCGPLASSSTCIRRCACLFFYFACDLEGFTKFLRTRWIADVCIGVDTRKSNPNRNHNDMIDTKKIGNYLHGGVEKCKEYHFRFDKDQDPSCNHSNSSKWSSLAIWFRCHSWCHFLDFLISSCLSLDRTSSFCACISSVGRGFSVAVSSVFSVENLSE